MNKVFTVVFTLFFSLVSYASPPATPVEITPENINALGFNIEVQKVGEENYVRLTVPLNIDVYWVPVTTQSYTYSGEESGFLNKVELGSPTKKVSINSYYKPEKEDLMIGVYFLCNLDHLPCRGDWDSRLYIIQSVNNFLITKQSSGLQ